MRAAVPTANTIYLEPDIYQPDKADEADPSIRAVERSHSPGQSDDSGPMKPENPENPAPAPAPNRTPARPTAPASPTAPVLQLALVPSRSRCSN